MFHKIIRDVFKQYNTRGSAFVPNIITGVMRSEAQACRPAFSKLHCSLVDSNKFKKKLFVYLILYLPPLTPTVPQLDQTDCLVIRKPTTRLSSHQIWRCGRNAAMFWGFFFSFVFSETRCSVPAAGENNRCRIPWQLNLRPAQLFGVFLAVRVVPRLVSDKDFRMWSVIPLYSLSALVERL